MTGNLALRLLDQPVPRHLAARLLGCTVKTFTGIAASRLTLKVAFLAALAAARADLSAAREQRRKARALRKPRVLAIARRDDAAARRFAALVQDDLEQAAARLAAVDPCAALRLRRIAASLALNRKLRKGMPNDHENEAVQRRREGSADHGP